MKFLFLDVDEVLNSALDCPTYVDKESELCERCILLLKQIADATDCKIVVSSAWRLIPSNMRILYKKLAEYGMKIFDETPRLQGEHCRGDEIRSYLKPMKECGLLDSFVILDDDSDMGEFNNTNLVKTSYSTGLQQEHVDRAIAILNKGD